jgi:hypothetical protein
MRRALAGVSLCVVLLCGAVPVRADSVPIIQGAVAGLELCPQSLCGAAVFVGVFHGQVGARPNALGLIAVAVEHDPLPELTGDCAAITAGLWDLRVGLRRFVGSATGELCYNGDNTYGLDVGMELLSGGSGQLFFAGTLDHNVFPPTIRGDITQTAPQAP